MVACRAAPGYSMTFRGRVFSPNGAQGLPQPVAFFPLTEGAGSNVTSWPTPDFMGSLNRTSMRWVPDSVFGYVAQCERDRQDVIVLDPVSYGADGPFSVNLWFRGNGSEMTGELFEYIFSHSAYATTTQPSTVSSFQANQIHMFLPEDAHPAHGLLRSVVKDSNDADTSVFVDSDGHADDNTPRIAANETYVNTLLSNGNWHMATITSRPGTGTRGFLVYVDGRLAAQMPAADYNASSADAAGLEIDGGDPLEVGHGAIYLCGRADGAPDRHFSGSVAHLALYNAILTPMEIRMIFTQICTGLTHQYANFSRWIDQWAGNPQMQSDKQGVTLCSANADASDSMQCNDEYICGPLTTEQVYSNAGVGTSADGSVLFSGRSVGVCAQQGGALLPPQEAVPMPKAYFPFSNYTVSSWPVPQWWAWNSTAARAHQTVWEADDLFGTAVRCGGLDGSDDSATLSLSHLQFGRDGPWAINLWVRQADNVGDAFQYLLSTAHPGGMANDSVFEPNQVHIYLPDAGHPAHGLVRVIAKDSNDAFTGPISRTWLDSDGLVGSNDIRNNTLRTDFRNGWHMITVTTLASAQGYAVYVDGFLRGALQAPRAFFHVDGGDPMNITSDIVLCGRADHAPGRTFNGLISQLAIFNDALSAFQVRQMYAAVMGRLPAAYLAPAAAPAVGPSPGYAILAPGAGAGAGGVDISGLPSPGAAAPVPNPSVPLPAPGVSGTGATQYQGISLGPVSSSAGVRAGVIAGIIFALLAAVALVASLAVFIMRKRRGHWRKAHLDAAGVDPAHDPAAPGAGGAVALSTAGAAQGRTPDGKGEGKARLFTGAPSTSAIDIAAHSAP
ncbi:hypothetical protein WJX81_004373 [Elliptochloris bilobata]|uniref:Uncharacterized protein n=1 Tax=Elliptochloris bilobata TaxID=381761 RepID=A0AAW1RZF3_9CHLO